MADTRLESTSSVEATANLSAAASESEFNVAKSFTFSPKPTTRVSRVAMSTLLSVEEVAVMVELTARVSAAPMSAVDARISSESSRVCTTVTLYAP